VRQPLGGRGRATTPGPATHRQTHTRTHTHKHRDKHTHTHKHSITRTYVQRIRKKDHLPTIVCAPTPHRNKHTHICITLEVLNAFAFCTPTPPTQHQNTRYSRLVVAKLVVRVLRVEWLGVCSYYVEGH